MSVVGDEPEAKVLLELNAVRYRAQSFKCVLEHASKLRIHRRCIYGMLPASLLAVVL